MTMTLEAPTSAEAAWKEKAKAARDVLAEEWRAREPSTPDEIQAFYRDAINIEADLEAFHEHPDRKRWTEILIHLAKNVADSRGATEGQNEVGAKILVDVGSGAGHDMRALREAGFSTIVGVEPNTTLRERSDADGFTMFADVADAPIETADLVSCFDVLEHIYEPEDFLRELCRRMRIGGLLVETAATFDLDTPLHLKKNAGWHPGRVLEQNGFIKIGEQERMRVWRRYTPEHTPTTGLVLCAYRGVSLPTFASILALIDNKLDGPNPFGWRVSTSGEAGINRSRSIMASRWWRETADDVFLMIDDDIVFSTQDAETLVTKCRNGHDVICAAYPVRDGGHLAIRGRENTIQFFDAAEPVEIQYAATGFLAVHRRVLDALIPTLPLCHGNQPWSFWPLFDFRVVEDDHAGGHNYLSEDWNFSDMARAAGFGVWLDPSIKLGHLGLIKFDIANMTPIHRILTGKAGDHVDE